MRIHEQNKAMKRALREIRDAIKGMEVDLSEIKYPLGSCSTCGGHCAAGVCTACGELVHDCDCPPGDRP